MSSSNGNGGDRRDGSRRGGLPLQAASRVTGLVSSVMDLHVRIALQEADREKRRLIGGAVLLVGGLVCGGWTQIGRLMLAIGQDAEIVRGAARYLQLSMPALLIAGTFECLKRYLMAQVRKVWGKRGTVERAIGRNVLSLGQLRRASSMGGAAPAAA
jgi:hypothetical protein